MHIRRVLVLAVAATTLATAPALFARQNNQQPNRRDQERRSQQEQRDTQALVQMVDAIAAGDPTTPLRLLDSSINEGVDLNDWDLKLEGVNVR